MLLCVMFASVICGCNGSTESIENEKDTSKQWDEARTTPYGKYPDTITYTLGKQSSTNNSNMPVGDTYEDNAYTRYLLKQLNIKNENTFEAMDDAYNTEVSMAIALGEIPDIMVVNSYEDLQTLVNMGMIAD